MNIASGLGLIAVNPSYLSIQIDLRPLKPNHVAVSQSRCKGKGYKRSLMLGKQQQ